MNIKKTSRANTAKAAVLVLIIATAWVAFESVALNPFLASTTNCNTLNNQTTVGEKLTWSPYQNYLLSEIMNCGENE